ncbi:Ribonuclease H-like domain [Cinara cedri]|uniref:Ribonuclease H-like domain n=1 Tax=Cinara cedri TaxID=506608 RepID=A0A5E4NMM8_9HEMI|nr:Ribonuclease H-like domain [Cinara cedri]
MNTFECTFADFDKVFSAECSMTRHAKLNDSVKFNALLCIASMCPKSFTRKGNHDTHVKMEEGLLCQLLFPTFKQDRQMPSPDHRPRPCYGLSTRKMTNCLWKSIWIFATTNSVQDRPIFPDSDIEDILKQKLTKVLFEEDIYQGRGKGRIPIYTYTHIYKYTESWDKLEEDTLPEKEDFYSTLTEENVKDDEYEHAKIVWRHFGCKTSSEYSKLYLKIDIMLLTDVFENIRDICMTTYNLDPAFYYTKPGFSFDCMLKYTKINLELLSDYDMLLKFERGIRGGLVQARFAMLDISKTKIYNYHYNVMRKHFKDNINLMYTDTDPLVYHIATRDFYADLLTRPGLL